MVIYECVGELRFEEKRCFEIFSRTINNIDMLKRATLNHSIGADVTGKIKSI